MKTISIQSYSELERLIFNAERSFLLLYKGGSEQSECALNRISNLELDDGKFVMTADVNQVRDIHERFSIDTAPSLLVFRKHKVINIVRGCQTQSAFGSILAGREIGAVRTCESEKTRQVIVYTTPTCSWCTTLKTYLDSHQVSYREVNVASDTAAAEAMVKKSGQQGVPQTEIDGQMIVGFDKSRINQLLKIK